MEANFGLSLFVFEANSDNSNTDLEIITNRSCKDHKQITNKMSLYQNYTPAALNGKSFSTIIHSRYLPEFNCSNFCGRTGLNGIGD